MIRRPESGRTGTDTLALTERIIRASSRDHPADAVVRHELKSARGVGPPEAAQVVRGVFAYFRWQGWLRKEQPIRQQIRRALDLADRFARDPESFADEDLLKHAVPSWVWREVDRSAAWARSLQREPRVWIRAKPGEGRHLSNRLDQCRPFGSSPLDDTLEYRGDEDLFRTKQFHDGLFELQDISSQVVGLVCDPQPGSTWWDACAGEGGKTLHLSALMRNKGLIWASDRAEWRLAKLKRRAARAGVFNYRAIRWDGGEKLPTKTKFDGVLVDAPCAGIGTWQRNPHARWTTSEEDVHELSNLQMLLLGHAAAALKPGGRLVYAVCTLTRSETKDITAGFDRQFQGFQRELLRNPLDSGSAPVPELCLWPQDSGGNGMYIAVWRRSI